MDRVLTYKVLLLYKWPKMGLQSGQGLRRAEQAIVAEEKVKAAEQRFTIIKQLRNSIACN